MEATQLLWLVIQVVPIHSQGWQYEHAAHVVFYLAITDTAIIDRGRNVLCMLKGHIRRWVY